MKHPLITHATTRPYCETPKMPSDVHYDLVRGLWHRDGVPLVEINDFICQATKKCDQETGEDQKGE